MLRKEISQNFEAIRAIVCEFSHQVSWSPIGHNTQLTQELREAFYRHKRNGVFDCFHEQSKPYGDYSDYYFLLKDDLSPSQIKDLHQFVSDFASILIKYLDVMDVCSYTKFANRYLAPEHPRLVTPGKQVWDTKPADLKQAIKLMLESMLESSRAALGHGQSGLKLFDNSSQSKNNAPLQSNEGIVLKKITETSNSI